MQQKRQLIVKVSVIFGLVLIVLLTGALKIRQLKNIPKEEVAIVEEKSKEIPLPPEQIQEAKKDKAPLVETKPDRNVQPRSSSDRKTSNPPKPSPVKPAPKPSVAPSSQNPSPVSAQSSVENQILAFINKERLANGLSAVTRNGLLDQASYLKSQDMATKGYFAHTAPDGTSDIEFVKKIGYKYQAVGVNLAHGQFGGPEGLVRAWMNSEGHKKNILADFGQQIGIGISGDYFTMIIAKPL